MEKGGRDGSGRRENPTEFLFDKRQKGERKRQGEEVACKTFDVKNEHRGGSRHFRKRT
jgi:hypothetical protein